MKNYHRKLGRKLRSVGENRKNINRKDTEPDEESGQTNESTRSTVVEKKKHSRVHISYSYGENKSSVQVFISGHCNIPGN